VLPGPPVSTPLPRCPALSHSLPHPAADHRAPVAARPHLSVAPTPHRPRLAALPYSRNSVVGRGPVPAAPCCRPLCKAPSLFQAEPTRPNPPFRLPCPGDHGAPTAACFPTCGLSADAGPPPPPRHDTRRPSPTSLSSTRPGWTPAPLSPFPLLRQ
jgi:hypothetical protein